MSWLGISPLHLRHKVSEELFAPCRLILRRVSQPPESGNIIPTSLLTCLVASEARPLRPYLVVKTERECFENLPIDKMERIKSVYFAAP